MFKRAFAAACCASLLFAGAAAAEQFVSVASDARAIPVRYADLDLNQDNDAAAMLSRLRYAAYNACAVDELALASPSSRRAERACRSDALHRAIAELDAPTVTRQHAALLASANARVQRTAGR